MFTPAALVLGKQRRADNDAPGAGVEHLTRALDGVDASAGLARQALRDLRDQRGVIALAHGRIEIDELHEGIARELLDPVFEVVERQTQLFALHKLNNAAAEQIDGRNQHGNLTETPALASSSLSERALETPKWKMLAASAASAFPPREHIGEVATVPAPPDAMTGMLTASLTAAVSSQSNPARVPSESMEVSRISPAPRASASRAHSTTRRPVGLRPPCTNTCASRTGSAASGSRRASMATTTACAPKLRPMASISVGIGEGGGVDADLVCAGVEYALGIARAADASADGERNEQFAGRAANGVEQRLPAFVGGGDVEKHDFVGAFAGVARGLGGGIAGIDEVDELHAFDDASAVDVEAGDDAFGQHVSHLQEIAQYL